MIKMLVVASISVEMIEEEDIINLAMCRQRWTQFVMMR